MAVCLTMNILLISSGRFLGGFGLVLGVLSILGIFQDEPPPASPEFAEFFHQNAEWSLECEAFLDKEGRAYDSQTGVLTYPWLGTEEQEAGCWNSVPPAMSVVYVFDVCEGCSVPSAEICQNYLRGTGVDGLTPRDLLVEESLGNHVSLPESQIEIWSGTLSQQDECQRYLPIGDHDQASPLLSLGGRTNRYFAIELETRQQ